VQRSAGCDRIAATDGRPLESGVTTQVFARRNVAWFMPSGSA